jgi:N-acetyl-anhydromuramyl-L-alanine amidase AmpD
VPECYWSPNHQGARAKTVGVILHSTRGGTADAATEYAATIRWFMASNSLCSAHRVIGAEPGMHAQLVDGNLIAWHAGQDNQTWLGIELCQPHLGDPITDYQIETAAQVVAAWCRKYGIEPSRSTIKEHRETAQGASCGKSDIGLPFDIVEFVALVWGLTRA